ncbi:unnamed protein product [Didymodactylos carnosus]|uniref:Interferon-induced transmembrane protein n=1 Tax=Didymodactylos carnosus TaxID=1234261 RepID=A0A814N9W8_9BILA|nr:unnamed protein product [Didymodactylos carnosus]CAF3855408.1 unnamed protein product [Didymodactylos carnosus]
MDNKGADIVYPDAISAEQIANVNYYNQQPPAYQSTNVTSPYSPYSPNTVYYPASAQPVLVPVYTTSNVPDFMCWSIANIFFGGIILGLISVAMSIAVRNYKQSGDNNAAKGWSIATGIWNGFVTLGTIALIVVIIVVIIPFYRYY